MKTDRELLSQAKAAKESAAKLQAIVAKSVVLQNETVQDYIVLLEKLFDLEVKLQKVIAKEAMKNEVDEFVMTLFNRSFGKHTEPIRAELNERMTDAMHSSLIDSAL